ncbi:MAG: dihydrofolate reductase [Firmicutes bacterium]|nr:dihydrofolate reductase [Bacillota bacterium]
MNMIVAADKNWGIGRNGDLLTNLPGDLKYFKERTLGKVVVMGRKTLESLPGGKPLPGRTNIVLTGNRDFVQEGCTVVHSIEEMRAECSKYEPDNVMLIGGAMLYNLLMEECESLFITKMDGEFEADVFIKNADELSDYKIVWQSEIQEENGIKYQFLEYKREK